MWKVYAVKTIYRTKAVGTPKDFDKYFRRDLDLIEERVVTVKARSFDEAVAKGEKEAVKYASESVYLNPYRQKVVQKYIGSIIAFEPFDEVAANVEVFSTTYLVRNALSDKTLTDRMIGTEFVNEMELRRKFLNSEFSGFVS